MLSAGVREPVGQTAAPRAASHQRPVLAHSGPRGALAHPDRPFAPPGTEKAPAVDPSMKGQFAGRHQREGARGPPRGVRFGATKAGQRRDEDDRDHPRAVRFRAPQATPQREDGDCGASRTTRLAAAKARRQPEEDDGPQRSVG